MQCVEYMVVSCVALVPPMALLGVLFYNNAVDPSTFFIILCITAFCCFFTFLWHRWWHSRVSYHPYSVQSEEDVENGRADGSTGEGDFPPKYDSVMAEPPPYDHLYTGAQTGCLPIHDSLLEHDQGVSLASGAEEEELDAGLPSYSEVTKESHHLSDLANLNVSELANHTVSELANHNVSIRREGVSSAIDTIVVSSATD